MNANPMSFRSMESSTLVISQNTSGHEESKDGFRFLSFNEYGLSKSRNRAIHHATSDIALIADDDVSFCENYENKIKTAFDQFPDADILTFKILTPSGQPYKNYSEEAFKHTRSSIFKVSSVEIVIKLDKVREAQLQFDEQFGLGSTYPSSEEMIFLNDALDKGFNMYFIPEYIVCHPVESSGKVLDESFFRSKGALVRRLYGSSIHLGIGFAFLFKQFLKSQKSISLFSAIKESFKGFTSVTNL